MKRLLIASLLPVVLLLGGLSAPPSSAGVPSKLRVDATSSGVEVRQGACRGADVWAVGNWDQFEDPRIRIVIRDPRGRVARRAEFANRSGEFERSFRFCYSSPEGRYTAFVTVVAEGPGGNTRVGSDRSHFRVIHIEPKADADLALRTGRFGSGRYPFAAVGTLTREGRLYPGRLVLLGVRYSGGWLEIDRSRTGWSGNWRGKVGWDFKPNGERWIMFYPGNDTTRHAWSRSFHFWRSRDDISAARLEELQDLVRRQ